MAFLFLPTIHNSLFNQSLRDGNSASSQKTSTVLDAACTSLVKLVLMFQLNSFSFYVVCSAYWGVDTALGTHLVCLWACGVFLSHYLKDLLMIPRLGKPKLSQEYCKRLWKNNNVNFDSSWDIPYEPIVSFTSTVTMVGLVSIFSSPDNIVLISSMLVASICFPAYSFYRLNINSVASIVSSLLIGVTMPFTWLYCVVGREEFARANELSMFPLAVSGGSLLYSIVGVQVFAVVLLLAYPIPFKYDFSLPYVSKSLFTASGFVIGAIIYMYLVYDKDKSHAQDCNPVSSNIMHAAFDCLQNLHHCFEGAGVYNKKASIKVANNQPSTDCFYAGSFNVFFSLLLFSVMQVLSNNLFAQKLKYSQISFPCFRPRLTANASSILENSVHKLNPPLESAREQLYECKRLRRQYEDACALMKKKQRLSSTSTAKNHGKYGKSKALEKKALSSYELIIYEYAVPRNICEGLLQGFIASFVVPYMIVIVYHP